MKKLLLTGFEPFLGLPINPTEKIVKELQNKNIGQYQIQSVLLPVDFEKGPELLISCLNDIKPDAVISLGLAAGRKKITPERIAINCRDGEPDNNGVVMVDSPIYEDEPAGYFSTLPIREIVQILNENGYPANISNSAGTYLCNNIMYTLLNELNKNNLHIPAGFIHIPASHELVIEGKKNMPSWSQRDLQQAIELIIENI
ncbi:pyroglutamyl-peptidase I [Heyndrickxia sp. NPDC080065]|uniref:pyroglutamyl-peptidase I n=1 Tax=Heyndrickxia sp. NPDC080065 TaxID=3390568 RepID=UPI003CFF8A58